MSTVAIMLVKDEADVIQPVVEHMLTQVDEVRVYDNQSTDDTEDLVFDAAQANDNGRLFIYADKEPGYYQSRKMTKWARRAYEDGYDWVLPVDADEYWYVTGGRTLSDYLGGVPPDVQVVTADLYNHLPTAEDDEEDPNPLTRIGWRQRAKAPLPKVAVRLRPDVTIHAGNHGASFSGTGLTIPGLVIRHYSWRSEEQYLRKMRNGYAAYAATDLPQSTGAHWRMWGPETSDQTIRRHFRTWFYSERPREDDSLIYDPAPLYAKEEA